MFSAVNKNESNRTCVAFFIGMFVRAVVGYMKNGIRWNTAATDTQFNWVVEVPSGDIKIKVFVLQYEIKFILNEQTQDVSIWRAYLNAHDEVELFC